MPGLVRRCWGESRPLTSMVNARLIHDVYLSIILLILSMRASEVAVVGSGSREFVLHDADYDEAFDRFEYWFALIWTDENPKSASLDWVPVATPLGRFASRARLLP